MNLGNLISYLIICGVILFALIIIGVIIARLYKRSTKEQSFVRTGFGGQAVIMNGGALVLPVLHEIIWVNMNTLRLEVKREKQESLITKDKMRVDVGVEFYVRVNPTEEAIAAAAQTLGARTLNANELRTLIEGKFVAALRACAAQMDMAEMHEHRSRFVQSVQSIVVEDLAKNGLELESSSLTHFNQTKVEYFDPQNAFDAEGLTRLTEQTENRRKERNNIEQETAVSIATKNLEANRQQLEIEQQNEFAKLAQEREIETRKAQQAAEIAAQQADRQRESQQAQIAAKQQTDTSRIAAERTIKEQEVEAERKVTIAKIEKDKAIQIAQQATNIEIAGKSRDESVAKAEADQARAEAVKAEESVVTSRQLAVAEREKSIQLVEARKKAEQDAIGITVAAEADRDAAKAKAESLQTQATAEAEADRIRAEGIRAKYAAEADGKRMINEADNTLSPELIAMQVKMLLIKELPKIIEQSVKPLEQIDGIKIIQIEGINGANGGSSTINGESTPVSNGNLSEQVVASALRYRAQAPLIDQLMQEVGLSGGSPQGLVNGLLNQVESKTE
ncbi:flotillin family protein [Agitococcus lubricus]|uniref:Putative membrane protein YqiK n=1 Tax=Agitococcus lubricus TaxID=1077255 RepID=A0A2T5IWD4_9GAMM|nr:flotillin domain-containing protein [Agitococcus lubricus]PTQ88201.1 putative membrane protein YqiK [Agitococcus lubricus]